MAGPSSATSSHRSRRSPPDFVCQNQRARPGDRRSAPKPRRLQIHDRKPTGRRLGQSPGSPRFTRPSPHPHLVMARLQDLGSQGMLTMINQFGGAIPETLWRCPWRGNPEKPASATVWRKESTSTPTTAGLHRPASVKSCRPRIPANFDRRQVAPPLPNKSGPRA